MYAVPFATWDSRWLCGSVRSALLPCVLGLLLSGVLAGRLAGGQDLVPPGGGAAPATSELLVFLHPGTDAEQFARDHGLVLKQRLHSDSDACVFTAPTPEHAQGLWQKLHVPKDRAFTGARPGQAGAPQAAASADARVRHCFLNERRHYVKCPFTPNDPYFHRDTPVPGWPGQWHLKNEYTANLDARVSAPWSRGITGQGVTCAVVDDCTQTTHPDLAPNYDAADSWDFGQNDAVPDPVYTNDPVNGTDEHGVSTSGVMAARGGNGIGGTGAAPFANLAGLRIDFITQTDQMFADAGQYHSSGANTNIKVKNHSYGYDKTYVSTPAEDGALDTSAAAGTIHCFAAGNERTKVAQDSNKLMVQNNPNVVCVAALGSDGTWASYSNFGACVFVTAPSSSFKAAGLFGITTTDRTGTAGYNNTDDPADTFPDLNYTSTFGGTSSAAPLVAGVLVLVKQVQPALNVRFAKHLLVRTSDVVDASDSTTASDGGWRTNAAGFKFNQDYGFGLINADKLTQEAVKYSGVTALTTESQSASSLALAIPDNSLTGVSRTFTMASTTPLEDVLVTLNVTHARRGQIEAYLTAPSGYTSRLMIVSSSDTAANIAWTFLTNAFWGENPQGTWTLKVCDRIRNQTGTWTSYTVTTRMGQLIPMPPPAISGVVPSHGPATLTQAVTINGSNFEATQGVTFGGTVTFGGVAATNVSATATQIICTAPTGAAGTATVVVTNPDTQAGSASYTYDPPPSITSLSPNHGPATLTQTVSINGSNFVGTPSVSFGGNPATNVSATATRITCTAPTGTAGTATVVVTNPDSQAASASYTYDPPPSISGLAPSHGPATLTQTVSINGSNFVGTPGVTFGGNPATNVSATATRITCTAPTGAAGTAAVVVTNPDNQAASASYTYDPAPAVTGISPAGASAAGGVSATLTGSDFSTAGTPSVAFDGAAATVVSVQSGTLVCIIPAHANPFPTLKLTVNVVVTNPDGQSASRTFQYYSDIEGNVYPRGTLGGGARPTIFDVGLIRQFVSASLVPSRGIEFQKADCYPSGSLGDGKLDIFDVGQVRSYVSGAALNAAGGPSWYAPVVNHVTPNAGPDTGGTAVTITGNYFETGVTVTFGGAGALNVVVASATQITCTTPAHADGAVTVTVTNAEGTAGSKASAFTYQPPGP